MSDKDRAKKDHRRKDKENQAMKEASRPRKQQASIRFGEQKPEPHPERRRGERRT